MTNRTDQWKVFRYYEGLCSSGDFTKEIAKVLSLGVKDQGEVNTDYNWDIVFPAPDSDKVKSDGSDYDDKGIWRGGTPRFKAKIDNQVSKISDTVILKTTTTSKGLTAEERDDLTVDDTQNAETLTMYLEIYKPAYLADPEQYPLDCERSNIIPKLITRSIYEKSFKSRASAEDELIEDGIEKNETNGRLEVLTREDDSYTDQVMVDRDTLQGYLTAINGITGTTAVLPISGVTNSISINKDYAAKIRKENVTVYDFLRNTMQIEPAEYSVLEKIDIDISKSAEDESQYAVKVQGTIKIKEYKYYGGLTMTLSHVPTGDNPILEMRLNGIYTPIDKRYYTITDNIVEFKQIVAPDADDEIYHYKVNEKGTLVCRYEYSIDDETSGSSNTKESNMDIVKKISDRESILNNHYVLMRLFDNINESGDGPLENTYNAAGEIIKMNSHVSDWSKLSWYRDFEEVMLDHLDEDVSTSTITDGSVVVPIETPGLNSDTKIRYWINCNNDRFSLIVMGNPSLDYNEDRHLISACYCGAIDSFDNSINDTAGNFALFTSSSTEPCSTKLSVQKKTKKSLDPTKSEPAVKSDFVANKTYVISLPEGEYFDRTSFPKFVTNTMDENVGVEGARPSANKLLAVKSREFTVVDGKSQMVTVVLPDDTAEFSKVYIYATTYTESNVITSGVSRDIFGNTVNVVKTNTYGKNTSDGVTSIMMYHTRSKAYYQKHHMLFATTEEYMSKVMYGKSMYTGEYYADRIKVTHGNDGPRGILSDLLVIDSASLYALDELVINKDFEKDKYENEETFIYFPITAPFSPLSDSPNATYGLAIKKEEKEPRFTDEAELLTKSMSQINSLAGGLWKKVYANFYPMDHTNSEDVDGNNPSVYWKVVPGTGFYVDDEGFSHDTPNYSPIKIAIENEDKYKGNAESPLSDTYIGGDGNPSIVLTAGTQKSDKTNSYIKIAGFAPNALTDDEGQAVSGEYENIYYGISDTKVENLNNGANIVVAINDGSQDPNHPAETFKYSINGVPYSGQLDASKIAAEKTGTPAGDVTIIDADPNKYLVLYSGKEKSDGSVVISKFANVALKSGSVANALLQYPCDASITCTNGSFYFRGQGAGTRTELLPTQSYEYDSQMSIVCIPDYGYEFEKITVLNEDGTELANYVLTDAVARSGSSEENNGYLPAETTEKERAYPIFELDAITQNQRIEIKFIKVVTA